MTTSPPVTAEQRAAEAIRACGANVEFDIKRYAAAVVAALDVPSLLAEAREEGRQDGIRQGRVATYDEIAALVAHLRPHFTPLDVARYLAESADQLRSLLPPSGGPVVTAVDLRKNECRNCGHWQNRHDGSENTGPCRVVVISGTAGRLSDAPCRCARFGPVVTVTDKENRDG